VSTVWMRAVDMLPPPINTHVCTECGVEKTLDDFYERKSGYYSYCKPCGNKKARRWAKANRARVTAKAVEWQRAHPDARALIKRSYHKAHPTAAQADASRRKAIRLRAVPAWANLFFIAEAYDLCVRRTMTTGKKWNVDHVVPLRSKTVCGLHTHGNLAVILAAENAAKSNRYWPGMP